ncbi:biopolymer transporter ExbD [Myxococcota bacterium]|nr:biopolymer transporter ExbD [Myxococcota bacterium]
MTTKESTAKGAQPTSFAMYDATRKRRANKRHKREHAGGGEIKDLNITPMLDMMTILLVFLLKSFASSSSDVNVANLTLPHSTTKLAIEEALSLMVTESEILVDQKIVCNLDNGLIRPEDLPEGPGGYLVKPLYDVLEAQASHLKRIEEFGGTQFIGRIAIIADKNTSYRTLFRILYTAGRAEFGQFKLFVQKPS